MEERIYEGKIFGAKKPENIKGTELEEFGKCICKIRGKISVGTGFFCKIKYEEKLIPVLITNFYIIDNDFMENEKNLEFYINDVRKIVKLDKSRKLYSSEKDKYNIMIIKIKAEDEINNYLEIDENIFNKNSEGSYKDEPIYILHRPLKDTLVSYGKGIEVIGEFDVRHGCVTESGSSGAPIINLLTHKVIGIHKECDHKKNERFNIGTFLKFPLNELKQNLNKNNSINNNEIKKNNSNLNNNSSNNKKKSNNYFREFKKYDYHFFPNNYEKYKRICEEFKYLNRAPINSIGLTVGLFNDDNDFDWKVSLFGAKDTPYAGGLFYLRLVFKPKGRPDIYFLNPIYHLNVCFFHSHSYSYGDISVNFLNDWNPETSAKELLTKLYSIFYFSNPIDGFDYADSRRRKEFINNYPLYEAKVKYFTKKYAHPWNKNWDWDFSCNEKDLKIEIKPKEIEIKENINKFIQYNNDDKITLIFSNNGKFEISILCTLKEYLNDVIKRF